MDFQARDWISPHSIPLKEDLKLLAPWRPDSTILDEMNPFRQEMNQVFGRQGVAAPSRPALAVSDAVMNLWEDDEAVYVESELPGIKLEDSEISVKAS